METPISLYDFLPENAADITISDVVALAYENEDSDVTKKLADFLSDFYDEVPSDNPTMDDVMNMLQGMPSDVASYLYTDVDSIMRGVDTEEMTEEYHAFMLQKNINRKAKKFYTNSVADLLRTKAERKRNNIMNRSKRRIARAANKVKIAKYKKDWAAKVKKGVQKVKLRRKV